MIILKFIKRLLKLKRCYFCNKISWAKDRIRIIESPKDYEAGGILVPVCKRCYFNYSDLSEDYK